MTEITEAVEALTALVGEPAAHWSISGEPGDECVDVQVADLRALLSELTRLQAEVEGLRKQARFVSGYVRQPAPEWRAEHPDAVARMDQLKAENGLPRADAFAEVAGALAEQALATLQGQQS